MSKRHAVKELEPVVEQQSLEVEEQASVEPYDLSNEMKANLTAISQGYKWLNGSGGVETFPAPTITSLSPNTKANSTGAFTLTVNGTNFISGTTVYWGATAIVTTYVSATQVTAPITAQQIASAGTVQVKVQNGTLASGTSAFTIT